MKLKIKIAVAANADGEWHAYGFQSAAEASNWDEAMDSFDRLYDEEGATGKVIADSLSRNGFPLHYIATASIKFRLPNGQIVCSKFLT